MTAAWALQKAVYAALVADPVLTALCGARVFDAVPRAAAFPYVVLGDGEESASGAVALQHSLVLHVWSRGNGNREVKQIAAATVSALNDAALPLDGHVLIDLAFVSAEYARQSDGETYRGTLRFRAVTEPA